MSWNALAFRWPPANKWFDHPPLASKRSDCRVGVINVDRLINVYHQVTATELVKRPFPGAIIADIPGSPPRPASCAFS